MSESIMLADRAKMGGWWHQVPDSWVAWDQQVFDSIKAESSDGQLFHFAEQVSHHAPGVVLIVLLLAWLFAQLAQRQRPTRGILIFEILSFLLIVASANFFSDELKLLFGRLKPHLTHNIPGTKQPMSFPSNHSFNMATIWGFWTFMARFLSRKNSLITIVILTGVWGFTGWTRIYLGEHFPLDVLTGGILGFGYGFYGAWLLSLALRSLGKSY